MRALGKPPGTAHTAGAHALKVTPRARRAGILVNTTFGAFSSPAAAVYYLAVQQVNHLVFGDVAHSLAALDP